MQRSAILGEDGKALKYSFYNALALLLLCLFCAAAYSIYFILQAFIKPLLWATLVGVCLFPFKQAATDFLRGWLKSLDEQGRPLTIGVVLLPLTVVHDTAESFVNKVMKYVYYILGFIVLVPTLYLLYENGYLNPFFNLTVILFNVGSWILNLFAHIYSFNWFITITLVYCGATMFLWDAELIQASIISFLSSLYWLYTALLLLSFTGSWQFPLFLLCLGASIFGILYSPVVVQSPKDSRFRRLTTLSRLSLISRHSMKNYMNGCLSMQSDRKRAGSLPELKASEATPTLSDSQERPVQADIDFELRGQEGLIVRACFYALLWAHILLAAWTRMWPIHLACFMLLFAGLTRLSKLMGVPEFVHWLLYHVLGKINHKIRDDITPLHVLIPRPVQGLVRGALFFDKKFRHLLDASLDGVVSLLLIAFVLLAALLVSVFILFQIHNESLHLVSLTSNLLNSTMHSGLYSWLPSQDDLNLAVKSMVQRVFEHGNTWIKEKVDQLFESNPENKRDLERQILQLWQEIYFSFLNQTAMALQGSGDERNLTLAETELCGGGGGGEKRSWFWGDAQSACHQRSETSMSGMISSVWAMVTNFELLDYKKVVSFLHDNLGLLSRVLESVWGLLHSNISILSSVIMGIVSMLFGSSTVLLNFFLSSLIFITALFYLLAASGSSYLPLKFITSLTPSSEEASPATRSFHQAVESAISSVFAASLKLALFYGLYTILTHQLFGLDFVVVPAVLAAIFGAVPLLGHYWAALPGIVELAIVQGSTWQACLLFLAHWLPTQFLDTAVYSEIKGAGHPYLTGLSIAGGVYCYGFEGAFMGPIVLCCLLVAVNLYRVFLNTPTSASQPGEAAEPTPPTDRSRSSNRSSRLHGTLSSPAWRYNEGLAASTPTRGFQ